GLHRGLLGLRAQAGPAATPDLLDGAQSSLRGALSHDLSLPALALCFRRVKPSRVAGRRLLAVCLLFFPYASVRPRGWRFCCHARVKIPTTGWTRTTAPECPSVRGALSRFLGPTIPTRRVKRGPAVHR